MKTTGARALLINSILSVALHCNDAAGAEPVNWPQFRGPSGSGLSPDDQPAPLHFGPDTNRLWQTPLPRGHSSPCIWGDRVFVTGFDATNKSLETLCLDRANGKSLWRKAAPALEHEKSMHEFSSPAASTPATDGTRVYSFGAPPQRVWPLRDGLPPRTNGHNLVGVVPDSLRSPKLGNLGQLRAGFRVSPFETGLAD